MREDTSERGGRSVEARHICWISQVADGTALVMRREKSPRRFDSYIQLQAALVGVEKAMQQVP